MVEWKSTVASLCSRPTRANSSRTFVRERRRLVPGIVVIRVGRVEAQREAEGPAGGAVVQEGKGAVASDVRRVPARSIAKTLEIGPVDLHQGVEHPDLGALRHHDSKLAHQACAVAGLSQPDGITVRDVSDRERWSCEGEPVPAFVEPG